MCKEATVADMEVRGQLAYAVPTHTHTYSSDQGQD